MTDRAELEAAIEAVLFVASEPIAPGKLLEVFAERERAAAEEALAAVLERYRAAPERGVFAERVAGGVRLATRPDLSPYLRRIFEVTGRNKLSMAALETLAIVAYRQPVTAPEVQELRGVNSKGVLSTLLEHRLVRLAGRKPVVGKPFLYKTTKEFLAHFGLDSVDELPPLEEFEEMLGVELGPGDPGAGASGEEE
ncbi:MAG: SMC-Scp complex subunit ScpB [Acidobacteriota bacterium]|nr:SMC-Scp complex subunit ScpB [Acidobacteriota bacterium]MDH3524253.1 SMC-Scp complex subunit ScpB [Acidobacteriota bacterium]